jgi:hypothetical protein
MAQSTGRLPVEAPAELPCLALQIETATLGHGHERFERLLLGLIADAGREALSQDRGQHGKVVIVS